MEHWKLSILKEPSPQTDSIGYDEVELKENERWNIATYHLRRAIGFQNSREEMWIGTAVFNSYRAWTYECSAAGKVKEGHRAHCFLLPTDNEYRTLRDAFRKEERNYPLRNLDRWYYIEQRKRFSERSKTTRKGSYLYRFCGFNDPHSP
ncbi:unnamed protein product [Lasius platythorax]|uniref:Uncharacterized protein n=1 Tax=Lasius platythorax TaxID=488582 RepID=A0AAV2NMY1_9HYME